MIVDVLLGIGYWVAVIALGSIAHEATHYVVALAFSREPSWQLIDWSVHYEAELPPGRVEYLIAGAPVIIGALVLMFSVWIWGIGGVLGSGPWLLAWGFYTLLGAVTNDFEFNPVDEELAY